MSLLSAIKNKIKGLNTVTYEAKPKPEGRKVMLEVEKSKPIAKTTAIRQYGDKGYKPSNGKGVGF